MKDELIKRINHLETAHQSLKNGYLGWAYERFPEDHGIGSNHNSDTTIFLKNDPPSQNEVSHICNEVIRGIRDLSNPMEKYQAYREVYFIHPSFHERWFFDDHLHYLANNLYTGKRGFGLNSFLVEINVPSSRIEAMATFCMKRTILLENILSGFLDSTLSDYEPISSEKFPRYRDTIKQIINPSWSPEKIASLMPEVFQVIQSILEKTAYRILDGSKLLSFNGWGNYAQCAINEGPIFYKISSESRTNIFKKISTTEPVDLQNELEKHYQIQIVRPFDVKRADSPSSQSVYSQLRKTEPTTPVIKSTIRFEQKDIIEKERKYRPVFNAIIEEFKQSAGFPFRGRATSSKENYIVVCKDLPDGILLYFCDFPEKGKFSVELNVNASRAPEYESIIRTLSKKQFDGLPPSNFWEQKTKDGTWLRLQLFYPDNTPPVAVVQGMFDLIEQSYPEIHRTVNESQSKA